MKPVMGAKIDGWRCSKCDAEYFDYSKAEACCEKKQIVTPIQFRFPGEYEDLERVREIGNHWGYGRCIQYLQHAWAEKLMKEHGFEAKTAAEGALMGENEVDAFEKGFRVLVEHVHNQERTMDKNFTVTIAGDPYFEVTNKDGVVLMLNSRHGEIPANMFPGKRGQVVRFGGSWKFVPNVQPTPPDWKWDGTI